MIPSVTFQNELAVFVCFLVAGFAWTLGVKVCNALFGLVGRGKS